MLGKSCLPPLPMIKIKKSLHDLISRYEPIICLKKSRADRYKCEKITCIFCRMENGAESGLGLYIWIAVLPS